MTAKRYRNRPICLPCMIASDGAGGIVLCARVEASSIIDLVQPGEEDRLLEMLSTPPAKKKTRDFQPGPSPHNQERTMKTILLLAGV